MLQKQMGLTPGIGSSSPLTWPYGVGLDAGGHYFRNWAGAVKADRKARG